MRRHTKSFLALLVLPGVATCFVAPPLSRLQQQQRHQLGKTQHHRVVDGKPLAIPIHVALRKTRNHHHAVSFQQRRRRRTLSPSRLNASSKLNLIDDPNDDNGDMTYTVAIRNTIFYILIAIVFGAGLWLTVGHEAGEEFFAGYIVEKSLSVDNLFVFLLLFDFFRVPEDYQGRILSWGIYGSIIMRAIMISLGAAALENFHEILIVFAGILIYSSAQVLYDVEDDDEEDLNNNPVIRIAKNIFPSTDKYDGDRFFTLEEGVKKATPLFICMIAVELSDVVFAVDSIPAVFGVTNNPLIVFSSNMFAILGLRSLYPILSKAATELKYLEPAVAVILAFIGGKMIAEYCGHTIPTEYALAVIISILTLGVTLSLQESGRSDVEEV